MAHSNTTPDPRGFRRRIEDRAVGLYTINAQDGSASCSITNYGARVVSLFVPDRNGIPTDVVLGYSTLDEYLRQPEEYMGAIVGRCANRIAAGLFVLEGETHVLLVNNGPNTLHGGPGGFHARVWEVADQNADSITLRYTSPDGEGGFPGTVQAEVTYAWGRNNTLNVSYRATTDKATLVNLSNHSYFNLSGEGATTVLDHELTIEASAITPVDSGMIPTGTLSIVGGTSFDFMKPQAIGKCIGEVDAQLRYGNGYDHNFVLTSGSPACMLRSPVTGITMRLTTDRPGMQFYSGNFLDGSRNGKSGKAYGFRSAVVLEPQVFPDAIHHPQFPGAVLRPGEVYKAVSEYGFGLS